jgi:signal transduction histidine kinase
MTLDIQGVVDGGVSGDETLGGPHRLEALYLALSSSQGLMRVLGLIVGQQTFVVRPEKPSSRSAAPYDRSLSVTITRGVKPYRFNNRRRSFMAAALSRLGWTSMSSTSLCARSDEKAFELSVLNAGVPIPPSTLEKLFQPFFRGGAKSSRQGLGLGLYIASEVARALGGTLQATRRVKKLKRPTNQSVRRRR